MTLIAGFTAYDVPMLFGDLLLSRYSSTEDPSLSDLPSQSDVTDVYVEGWGVSWRLLQKTFVINDHLAVAWSGHLRDARMVIRDLANLSQGRRLSGSVLKDYLTSIDEGSLLGSLSLIGMRIDEHNRIVQFAKNAHRMDGTTLGRHAYYAGSGGPAFSSTIRSPFQPIASGPQWFNALAMAHSLQAAFLTREINAARVEEFSEESNPIHLRYGGGYEVVVPFNRRLQKFAETTLIYWDLRHNSPTLFVRLHYVGNTLILRWGRTAPWAGVTQIPWTEQHCIAVPPVIGSPHPVPADPMSWPPFETRIEGHMIIERRDDPLHVLGWASGGFEEAPSRRHVLFEEDSNAVATTVKLVDGTLAEIGSYLQAGRSSRVEPR